jgi:putative lipoprotein
MYRSGTASLAALLFAGCAGMHAVPENHRGLTARVTGSVSYRERTALPPSARLTVRLMDVSRADAAARVLGEQVIEAAGRQVPFAFEIAYDAAAIDDRYSYAVQARLEDGGRLLFISDRHHPVITRGAPRQVDMVLKAVRSEGTGRP